ncbi:N-6 DNA methylase [Rhizohabitans arisaemae]|uniref:N-6 DNA methylase n=1 Tax=Rhizohabitans arisaemae TaxID=2720610 RepID=UPI0024B0BED5|nr:N-6 DNA methylase [Rhizohabitans arisaemae]
MAEDMTVNAGDIARLADVGRAAVSNWRKRYDDFPQPVGGTASSPLFSLREVESWATRHDKTFVASPGDLIWQRLRGIDDDLRLGDLVGHVGAYLLHLREHPGDGAAPAAVPGLPGGIDTELEEDLLRAVAEWSAEVGPRAAFDFLCERYTEAHSRRLLVTPEPIAAVMAAIAGGETVFDPCCGIGALLAASKAPRLIGQEIDPTAARLTAVRLLLRGDADVVVRTGDSLRRDAFPGERADAVLCSPPFNERTWGYEELAGDPRWEYGLPPRGESELAWVQHCLAHVRPGGVVVVMMPTAAAARRPGRRVRGNLLRSGALRAVVTLPPGSAPGSTSAPDLWVLRRPAAGETLPSGVLMVDAGPDLAAVERAWHAYDTDGTELPGVSRVVRIIDLLDDEVDLSTPRHLAAVPVPAARFPDLRDRLAAMLTTTVPDLGVRRERRELPATSVGELVKAGVVTVHQAPQKTPVDGGDLPVLTVADLVEGREPGGRTVPAPDTVLTEPGDVVTPLTPTDPVARVISQGGVALGPQLLLFRVDAERVDPHFLAGFLRIAGGAGTARASSASTRIDARRVRIPRLPIEEQRAYGAAFRSLTEFEDGVRAAGSLARSLVRLGFDGLAEGVLQP